jgi:DNA-binding beta-propeller fold protein YncE
MSVPMRRVIALVVLAWLAWARPVLAEDAAAPATPAPSGIAIDAEGDVYVSDYALDRIVKFGADGTVLAQWGGSGSAAGQFNAPFGLAVDASDTLFVVDQLNNRLQRFATDGTPLSAWGGPGAGTGELRTPLGVAVGGGRVYVADFGNDRVQVFGLDGSLLDSFGSRGSGDANTRGARERGADRDAQPGRRVRVRAGHGRGCGRRAGLGDRGCPVAAARGHRRRS